MEYLKGSCREKLEGNLCSYCQNHPFLGQAAMRIPQPVPDLNNPGHYLSVFDTPTVDSEGKPRQVDDFLPRAQIKIRFHGGQLLVDDDDVVSAFAKEFAVKPEFVHQYLNHLQGLKRKDSMRKKQTAVNRQQRNQLVYEDYKWQELVTENKLGSLQVSELNKYLDKHHVENIKHKRKSDKVSAIRRHVLQEELFGIDNTEGEAVDDGMESEDSEGNESEVMDEDTRESSEGESDDSNGADRQ